MPLVPFFIALAGQLHTKDDLASFTKINFPDGTTDGIDLVLFDQIGMLNKNDGIDANHESIIIDGHKFAFGDLGVRGVTYRFRAGLTFYNHRRQENAIMVMAHLFEDKIASFMWLLRLFAPGDVFAPVALVDSFGSYDLNFSGVYQETQGNMGLHLSEIEQFKRFYEHYLDVFRIVAEVIADGNANKQVASWAKRINNAIYFFNQSYFTMASNKITLQARAGNQLRLINLITALDSLCGDGGGSKEKISENAHVILGDVYRKTKEKVEEFYDIRSNYIHANPDKMVSVIFDRAIEELRLYAQKLILVNLELFASEPFRDKFEKSGLGRYFDFLAKVPHSKDLREAFERVFAQDDLYGKPSGVDIILKTWEQQVGFFRK